MIPFGNLPCLVSVTVSAIVCLSMLSWASLRCRCHEVAQCGHESKFLFRRQGCLRVSRSRHGDFIGLEYLELVVEKRVAHVELPVCGHVALRGGFGVLLEDGTRRVCVQTVVNLSFTSQLRQAHL